VNAWYYGNLLTIQTTLTALLLALSIQVPMRMGVFAFTGVGAYGIAGYTTAILVADHGLGAIPAIMVSAAAAGAICLLWALLVYRLNGLYLAMSTFAFTLIISVIAVNGGTLTGGPSGRFGVITPFSMGALVTISLIGLAVVALTERGRMGRRIDAVRDDPQLATSLGVSVRRYRLWGFAASGLLGGTAGAMQVLIRTTITPTDIGFHLIVLALTIIVIGGLHSWIGALLGAIVFTWLPQLLTAVSEWRDLIYGGFILIAAVIAPGGVHGVVTGWVRGRQRRRRAASGAGQPAEIEPTEDLGEQMAQARG
jgi:branched-chain amino acid transport system permease protein